MSSRPPNDGPKMKTFCLSEICLTAKCCKRSGALSVASFRNHLKTHYFSSAFSRSLTPGLIHMPCASILTWLLRPFINNLLTYLSKNYDNRTGLTTRLACRHSIADMRLASSQLLLLLFKKNNNVLVALSWKRYRGISHSYWDNVDSVIDEVLSV